MGKALILIHVIGTLYYKFAIIEYTYFNQKIPWVGLRNQDSTRPIENYIQCFYWSLATVSLIGTKGDSTMETTYTIIVLSFTVGVFAIILS